MSNGEFDEFRKLVQDMVLKLAEHSGGTIVIGFSAPADGGGTFGDHLGCGDWYAQRGLAQEFLQKVKVDTVRFAKQRNA